MKIEEEREQILRRKRAVAIDCLGRELKDDERRCRCFYTSLSLCLSIERNQLSLISWRYLPAHSINKQRVFFDSSFLRDKSHLNEPLFIPRHSLVNRETGRMTGLLLTMPCRGKGIALLVCVSTHYVAKGEKHRVEEN